ncbi:uracil-DNA glycosylase family protein [Thermococcus aciditolerans]|uniref:Uracil-DNA glycosylase n=1 Tax=Thermococcus aciditolerans TaxID=2598455 RepID=A0A5C0SJY0_9EURY|nr:uracil-DNA glycosylase family protein [Thermococcus aciditolerans]QEK14027.1 uracil-DNA glycosylase [Thermococcus aciditolerans]
MLLRFKELRKVGGVYINPRNFKVAPLFIRDWRDLVSLDEGTYGVYARTIYNPKQRFLIMDEKDEKIAKELEGLYRELLKDPLRFCREEYHRYQLQVGEFKGLPFANGWAGSGIVLVGEAPGRQGCGKTGICFYRDASGMLLRKTLFTLGLNPDFVYITNVVKCNPPKNRLRGFGEGELELLERELEVVKPKAIFAIGRTAEKALKRLGFEFTHLRHPAWYVRRGLREPNEEILEEYSTIKEAFGE